MRILIAATYGDLNGIETYSHGLAAGLTQRGHEVCLVSRSSVPTRRLDGPSLRPRSWVLRRLVGPFETLTASSDFAHVVAEFRPDVIHATYPEFAMLPHGRVPMIITAWHPFSGLVSRTMTASRRGESRRAEFLFGMSDRLAYRRAARIIAITPQLASNLVRYGPTDFIPPFCDVAAGSDRVRRRDVCVMVARWLDSPRKGLDLAVDGVRIARQSKPDLRLWLIGELKQPKAMPPFCEQLGLMDTATVHETVRQAGSCILPSTFEEFGYVGLEALALGVPLVCSALPAFSWLDERAGVFNAKSRTPMDFAAAIVSALQLDTFSLPSQYLPQTALANLEEVYSAVCA
jgi:glycosyltransferase involved in cell wall biosynthesis